MAVRRIARHADRIRHELVGHRGDRAFEDLGQPVIGVQFLPHGRCRNVPRQARGPGSICLPTHNPRCRTLALTPCRSGSFSSNGFRHAEYWPQSACHSASRLQERLALAVGCRLRLARIAPREFGVQEHHRLAHDFGDARALARREFGFRQPLQLAEDGFVVLGNIGQRKRAQPAQRSRRHPRTRARPPLAGSGSASA